MSNDGCTRCSRWRAVLVVLGAIVVFWLLYGCGAADDDQMEQRYQDCIDHGGDFKADGRDWSCTNVDRRTE